MKYWPIPNKKKLTKENTLAIVPIFMIKMTENKQSATPPRKHIYLDDNGFLVFSLIL